MSYRITKEYVWVGAVPDQIGALAEKLKSLSAGGLDLELIVSRRTRPGEGLVFISPLRTMEELEAAEKLGLAVQNSYRILRIKGPNVQGLGARIAGALAAAGLSVREYTAAALGEQSVTNISFDNDEDTDRAKQILEKALAK